MPAIHFETQHKKRLFFGVLVLIALVTILYLVLTSRKLGRDEQVNYTVKIVKETTKVKHYGLNYELVTLTGKPQGTHRSTKVILLHDSKLSAEVWQHTGTLKYLASHGYEAIGVNLPGAMGTKVQGKVAFSEFLETVVKGLKLEKDTLWIAPGMSGGWMLHFLMDDEGQWHIDKHVKGVIFVTPSHVDAFDKKSYRSLKGALFYFVYGAQDRSRYAESGKDRFRLVRNIRFEEVLGGGKACYVDRTERFHQIIDQALADIN